MADPGAQGNSGAEAGAGVEAALALPARWPPRLALLGLPARLAEPVAMLAEILGWQVARLPPGPAPRPSARLCLAMLPADNGQSSPPLVALSADNNLNEHISRQGMSIMDQPPCMVRLEQLLQALGDDP